MRFLIIVIFFLFLDWYVYQPFRIMTQGWSAPSRWMVMGIYWFFPLIAVIFTVLFATGQQHLLPGDGGRSPVTALLLLLYICKTVVLPFIMMDDIMRGVRYVYSLFQSETPYMPGRSRFLSLVGVGAGLLPFSTLLYGMWRNPYRYKVRRAQVSVASLPSALEGLRIIQISDIHSGSFTLKEPVENAIRMINDLDPDIICFTGDLVNNRTVEMVPFVDMFSQLKARYGVFSVLGNHDYGDYWQWPDADSKKANFEEMIGMHKQLGWNLLRNAHRVLPIGDSALLLAGVENYSANPRFHRYGDLNAALQDAPEDIPCVLLSHDPSHWEAQVLNHPRQIDLTLSGHTHGMQFGIEIPGWIKWSPIQYLYKQWAGLYQQSSQYLYVNRGLGFLGYPGRVGILPEITLIELRKNIGDA